MPAVDVAGQRPEMGEEVVRDEDRLGPLEMRVPGEVGVAGDRGAVDEDLGQVVGALGDVAAFAADEEPQGGDDLVVAAAAGVELGAGRVRRAR